MKGTETKLISFMDGSDKRFVIPVYQRNYNWKEENCKQLYDDLVKIVQSGRPSHFLGSVVSVHNDGGFNEYLVIDGQQRLTTVTLLLLAMCNLMEKDIVRSTKEDRLAEKIYKTYLINEWKKGDEHYRLQPVKSDHNAFVKLFEEDDDERYVRGTNMTNNYLYFFDRIKKAEISIDQLFDAISKLEIINISLNKDDNPQLIFESLNSTGLALNEGDKIRNLVLMALPAKEQASYYDTYWHNIEVNTKNQTEGNTDYDVSSFIRTYLIVKQPSNLSLKRLYFSFKYFVEDTHFSTKELLEDLLKYSNLYSILLNANTQDKELNACIVRLNKFDSTVTRPFFLEVLHLWKDGKLSLSDLNQIFLYTESYLFRRYICSLSSKAHDKTFATLHRDIMRYDGTADNYLEKFKYALTFKSDKNRFPCDDEFIDMLTVTPVYEMQKTRKVYLFERFENAGTVETHDVYKNFADNIYTIEHIMPQHLTPTWINELGNDYEKIHSTWLHRLANLTLTGYNSKYSNSPFVDKLTMTNGFRESHIYLNKWISEQKQWTLAELEQRNALLMQQAKEIWPRPTTEYHPETKPSISYTLDDDVNLSGWDITRFTYKNSEQPVSSWIDMMERVVKILHGEDKSVLTKLAYDRDSSQELSTYISCNPNTLRTALEIDKGIYLEKNTSTVFKISILRKLFKAFDANPDDLTFILKDSKSARGRKSKEAKEAEQDE